MSEVEYYTCTGCSCLCDDIEINLDGDEIKIVKTACRRGSKIFLEYKENRAKPMVDGKVVEFDN
ncbi:MAG TPA: formylmethanofuran dehydrogenase subunit B, partial [Archaeoglobus veneficus]|nr:formylmethanofuran dehydrogenase subunit B [Archaeoglobus veneficus]